MVVNILMNLSPDNIGRVIKIFVGHPLYFMAHILLQMYII